MRDDLILASTLGAATGVRSTAGLATLGVEPGLPGWAPIRPELARGVALAAFAGEVLADKLLPLPPRTDPLPLIGRAVLGACGAALAATAIGAPRGITAMLGAATAVTAAWIATSVRAAARARGAPDTIAAVLEDVVVIGLGVISARKLSQLSRS